MAAGLGARLKEITSVTPKSLIKVNQKPILEKNIEYMIEAGFERIILVVGYMSEKFEYLSEKYSDANLYIIYNEDYATSNTVSSMFRASGFYDCDSYVTTADIYLESNPYINHNENFSFYLLRPYSRFDHLDWGARLDENRRIICVDTSTYDGYAYTGISFWKLNDLVYIREKLNRICWDNEKERKQYWDELLLDDLHNIRLYAELLNDDSEVYEFDDMADVRKFEKEKNIKITY